MKAIILCAGQGNRLRPLTDNHPKGMIEIDGKTILDRQIELFKSVGIDNIYIIKGYKEEAVSVAQSTVKFFINNDYQITNMVSTLFVAKEILDGDVIISYADILYSETVLKSLLESKNDLSVVIDYEWESYFKERFEDPFEDAESLIINNDLIINIGKPNPKPNEVQGQYIGLMRFKGEGLEFIKEILKKAKKNNNTIGWGRKVSQAYMTDLIQELINYKLEVTPVGIHGGWLEIDTLIDYHLAPKRFKNF